MLFVVSIELKKSITTDNYEWAQDLHYYKVTYYWLWQRKSSNLHTTAVIALNIIEFYFNALLVIDHKIIAYISL